MRLHHYSIHTERTYLDWIKRYVHFHQMQTREDLAEGESKIEEFLTHLAVSNKVSASTQNQAMNALVFLYKRVLESALGGKIDAVRADRKVNVPVVLTRDEVGKVIPLLGRDTTTDRQIALRQRIANPGSRAAAGQGPGLSDETGDCEIGKKRQGPLYHAFGWFDSAAGEPSAKGKGAP